MSYQDRYSDKPSPLDVLLDNMWFHYDRVQRTRRMIDDAREHSAPDEEIRVLMARHLSARECAQDCAVAAAPYVHPKLGVIKIKQAETLSTMADDELIDALQTLSTEELRRAQDYAFVGKKVNE